MQLWGNIMHNEDLSCNIYYVHIMACFLWSPAMWFLNEDHIVDTIFLSKIVPRANL